MTIGYITSEYPHPEIVKSAGIATSLKNLAMALSQKGSKVIIFIYGQKKNKIVMDGAIELHLIASKTYKLFTWYFYRKHIQNYVNKVVKQKHIDIIEAPDWTGITAFMTFKVPVVIRFHGSDAYFCKLERRQQKFKNFLFEKMALKSAKAYIAPTTFAGHETAAIFNLDKTKIKTIHYGLELKNFDNSASNVYSRNSILYIGTIIRKKGVFELAEIFNKVVASNNDAKLILIGNDATDLQTGSNSTFDVLQEHFSEKAKTRFEYLGKIPYNEVQTAIKKAHVCVFPSFAETLGMVTIESMALQKPVVNSNIGWAKELISNGVDGYMAHPSDTNEYAKLILKLLEDEALCQTIGHAAREKVESLFDIEKNADINLNYYISLIG